jgi:hypothetical protein
VVARAAIMAPAMSSLRWIMVPPDSGKADGTGWVR